MSISEAKASEFSYLPPEREEYDQSKPILTVFIHCYYRLDLVRQSIQSVIDQDYPNVELILIDNGAKQDVQEHLLHIRKNAKNAALIRFAVNQFDWNDTEKAVAVCWNAALIHAKGDYVCHLSYDDMISPNYAARMVELFVENPMCVTAAPMPVSINEAGKISGDIYLRDRNLRGRYTDGCSLAFDMIEGSPRKLFAAPGEIFVTKRDVLLRHGGYDRINDFSQVLKYAILGVSGFDAEAALYWRHHEGQLNKQAKKKGVIWYSSSEKAWADSGIVEVWRQRFDAGKVKALLAFKRKMLAATPLTVIGENTRQGNVLGVIAALLNMVRECPALLPRAIYSVVRELLSMMFGRMIRRLRSRA